jgi:misacylated tRNA(Ala) deacylase
MSTQRVYLHDDQCVTTIATVQAVVDGAFTVDQSPFFVGGGGQPCDTGTIDGVVISGVAVDGDDWVWHQSVAAVEVGQQVELCVDAPRRAILSRYHTALHVLNTLAMTHYQAWITGAQMMTDYARIDFAMPWLDPVVLADLELRMNETLAANHAVRTYTMPPEEFAQRPDLIRTLNVKPPVYQGVVRIVEIVGFDGQACGGTHVRYTHEVGACTIFKSENKGKQNKRLYVRFVASHE